MSLATNRVISWPLCATEQPDGSWLIEWEDALRCPPTSLTYDEVLLLRSRRRDRFPFPLIRLEDPDVQP